MATVGRTLAALILTLTIVGIFDGEPGAAAPSGGQSDADAAAEMAYFLSYLESTGDFNTEYDFIHPDARRIIPRSAVVGWFRDNHTPRNPQPATITGVQFVSWTWEVTGVNYPYTAQVSFRQSFNDGMRDDVVRLVQDRNGVWRWFFGRTYEFVNQVIAQYAPGVPTATYTGDQLIDSFVGDVDIYWIDFFRAEPTTYSPPRVISFDQALKSGCGVVDPMQAGPFYCMQDETIYLNALFLSSIAWDFGEFVVPVVIAHEYAHHVQNEMGLLGGSLQAEELQADCLAGAWARDYATRFQIDEAELIAAMSLMIAIGGDLDHGPGTLRTKEFLEGFYDGSQSCF